MRRARTPLTSPRRHERLLLALKPCTLTRTTNSKCCILISFTTLNSIETIENSTQSSFVEKHHYKTKSVRLFAKSVRPKNANSRWVEHNIEEDRNVIVKVYDRSVLDKTVAEAGAPCKQTPPQISSLATQPDEPIYVSRNTAQIILTTRGVHILAQKQRSTDWARQHILWIYFLYS